MLLFPAGTTQTKTSGPAADSGPLTEEKAGFPEASAGPPGRGSTLDEELPGPEPRIGALSVEIVYSRIACLPGPGVIGTSGSGGEGAGDGGFPEHPQMLVAVREDRESSGGLCSGLSLPGT